MRLREGQRRGERILRELGAELRNARLGAGVSQTELGRQIGPSQSEISRIENGQASWLTIMSAARLSAAVGLDLATRAYPGGAPLRDAAHLALLGRLRSRISPRWRWLNEVPIPVEGDPRALDALLIGVGLRIGVEAETRLRDFQAQQREMELKRRDARLDRWILLLLRSRSNAAAVHAAGPALREAFPVPPRAALRALSRGVDPGGDTIVLL